MTALRKAISILFCLVLFVQMTIAQDSIVYSEIRKETVEWSCTKFDKNSVNLTLKNLLAVDTLKITKGLWNYYYDLGMTYYMKAGLYEQNEWHYLAISSFKKCIPIDKKSGDAYHNIAFCYYFTGDIKNAKIFLKLYKKYTKKEYWDNDFIERVENEK